MPQIPTLPDKRKKKETDEAILATPSPRFTPDQTVPFPKQSFLSPYAHTHTRAQKKRRWEKKGIRDKVSQEANDNDTQPP